MWIQGGISKLEVTLLTVWSQSLARSPGALSGRGRCGQTHVFYSVFFPSLLWVPFSAHPLNAGIF